MRALRETPTRESERRASFRASWFASFSCGLDSLTLSEGKCPETVMNAGDAVQTHMAWLKKDFPRCAPGRVKTRSEPSIGSEPVLRLPKERTVKYLNLLTFNSVRAEATRSMKGFSPV